MYVFEKKIVLTFYIQILTTTGFEKITVLTLNPQILLTNVLNSNNNNV